MSGQQTADRRQTVGAQRAAPIKALSVRQPWAWMVAAGYKTMETRKWSSNYVGPLLIHACGKFDKQAEEDYRAIFDYGKQHNDGLGLMERLAFRDSYIYGGLQNQYGCRYTGGIIALVSMLHCYHLTGCWEDSDMRRRHLCYFPIPPGESRYGFKLELKKRFDPPIPCKGALSLWTPPDDVIAQLKGTQRPEQ